MKKIGLVLAGGGGRGAYQIGVWKALRETGLDKYITSVSGTSVGGLNAALFLQNDLERAQYVWKSISMRKILTPKLESVRDFLRRSSFEPDELKTIIDDHIHQLSLERDGLKRIIDDFMCLSLFERDGLIKIIDENLNMKCFSDSKYNCWITCLRTDEFGVSQGEYEERCMTSNGVKAVRKYVTGSKEYYNLKFFEDSVKKQILLATSAIPFIFPAEEVEGHKLRDGGSWIFGGDNVPVKPLYEVDECNCILVIHLTNTDSPVNRKEFPNATLFELFPKKDSGIKDIFDFTAEGAERRINQGYDDNIELFKRIKENIHLNQRMLDNLADAYKREWQYTCIMDDLHRGITGEIDKYTRKEEEDKSWEQRKMS